MSVNCFFKAKPVNGNYSTVIYKMMYLLQKQLELFLRSNENISLVKAGSDNKKKGSSQIPKLSEFINMFSLFYLQMIELEKLNLYNPTFSLALDELASVLSISRDEKNKLTGETRTKIKTKIKTSNLALDKNKSVSDFSNFFSFSRFSNLKPKFSIPNTFALSKRTFSLADNDNYFCNTANLTCEDIKNTSQFFNPKLLNFKKKDKSNYNEYDLDLNIKNSKFNNDKKHCLNVNGRYLPKFAKRMKSIQNITQTHKCQNLSQINENIEKEEMESNQIDKKILNESRNVDLFNHYNLEGLKTIFNHSKSIIEQTQSLLSPIRLTKQPSIYKSSYFNISPRKPKEKYIYQSRIITELQRVNPSLNRSDIKSFSIFRNKIHNSLSLDKKP